MFKYITYLLLAILLLIFSCDEELKPVIEGCTIETTCNYNADATDDDDSCVFNQGCNKWCNGDEGEPQEFDCSDVCGGSAELDDCGVCAGGNASMDCTGVCDGSAVEDCAGICGGSAVEDCAGVCGGDSVLSGCDNACGSIAVEDCTGVCGGNTTDEECQACVSGVFDCSGVCDGSAVEDCAGVCGGDSVLSGCDNACGSTLENDECGVCGGGNASMDCTGVCDGSAVEDCTGICGGSAVEDCAGVCGGISVLDCAFVCDGSAGLDDCGVCSGNDDCLGCTDWYMGNFICDDTDETDKCCVEDDNNNDNRCKINSTGNNCDFSTSCLQEYEMECDLDGEFCDYDGAILGSTCSSTSGTFTDGGTGECKKECSGWYCNDITCETPWGHCDYEGAILGSTCSDSSGTFIDGRTDECILNINNDTFTTTGYITYYNTGCADGADSCCTEPECDGITLSIELIDASTLQVNYSSTEAIGGFQFDIVGATTTGGSGGATADAEFTISPSIDGITVIAFSFSGATIPTGSGTLTNLNIDTGVSTQLCLQNVVFSASNSIQITNCPEYTALWPAPGQQVECITP